MDKKRIVILGAGYGGVHAAKKLSKLYKKSDKVEILLIDKKPYHTLMTELHEVAGARVEPDAVRIKLKRIFAGSKVKTIMDEITGIDFEKKQLISNNNTYAYDYLIIGAGAEPAFFGIPGIEENSFTIWSFEDAIKIKEHVVNMFEEASRESDSIKRQQLLSFMVAGAGFTGIEVIGELAEWTKGLCDEYEIDKNDVSLVVIEAMCNILSVLNERLIKKSERYLKKKNIKIYVDAPIISAEKGSLTLKDGTVLRGNTLIWTCGVQGSSFSAGLGLTMGKRNRVQVNEYMQSVDYDDVYVIGDNSYIEEQGKPMPQIVEAALQTGETAAHNISAAIDGRPLKRYKSNYHGIMVSIGSRDAVANVMGVSSSGFAAMGTKHMVNLHYLYGIGGLSLVVSYIMHEFFDIRNGRSMVGSHLSNKTPIFWLAILRVYLGYIWLWEGIKKIKDGWLNPAMNFVATMPNSWDQPSDTANAVASATQITQYWPEPILKRPPALFEWFMDTFIAPNHYMFQLMIVLVELAIGLALIAGLFTLLASAASIFLCANFILSAMAGTEIFWHIFAAIALFGGAGRAFGLDYYVMPWLKHWWKKTAFARRTHLYIE